MDKLNNVLSLGIIILLFMVYSTLSSMKENMELMTRETIQVRQSIQNLPNNFANNGFTP